MELRKYNGDKERGSEMDNIHKIPFVMGVFATIIVGMTSYKTGVEHKEIYIRMSISMFIFFVVGLYVKKFIIKIRDELKEKEEALKEEEGLKELEELKEEEVLKRRENKGNNEKGRKIDLKAEEQDLYDDEFKPLEVNTIELDKKDQEGI